jgi:glycerol-3-phosphate cytidylyltransferase
MIVGITFSAFDLLHAGHVLMLQESKQQCDYLIAGLQVNPALERSSKTAPLQSLFERYTQLRGSTYVDEIIPYQHESEIHEILSARSIHKRFIGEEYAGTAFTADELCKQLNIEIIYNKRKHYFSSSALRDKINKLPPGRAPLPTEWYARWLNNEHEHG